MTLIHLKKSGINEYPLWTSDEDETTIPNSESINGAPPLLLIIEDNADVAIYTKAVWKINIISTGQKTGKAELSWPWIPSGCDHQ